MFKFLTTAFLAVAIRATSVLMLAISSEIMISTGAIIKMIKLGSERKKVMK